MTPYHTPQKIALMCLGFLIILFGIFFFSGDAPITGMIIKEPTGKSFQGVYSFSHSMQVPLDLSIYQKISSHLPLLISCTQRGTALETCIADAMDATKLTWDLDCDKGLSRVFYDVVESFEDCLNSSDSNCYCEKPMGGSAYILRNELSGKDHTISILKKDETLTFSDRDGKLTHGSSLRDYSSNHLAQRLRFLYGQSDLVSMEAQVSSMPLSDATPALLSSSLIFYKGSKISGGKTALSIDLIKEENGKLLYPTNAPVLDVQGKPLFKSDARPCAPAPKNIVRFCVHDPSKKYLIYDELEGDVKERPIVIRFAAHLPDLAPPAPTSIKAQDFPKASHSVFVAFQASPAKDVVSYKVYIAPTSELLSSQSTAQLSTSSQVAMRAVRADEAILLDTPLETSSCRFDYRKACMFKAGKEVSIPSPKDSSEKTPLYTWIQSNGEVMFALPLFVEEDKGYALSVTAIDKAGKEIDNVKQKMPITLAVSLDDLPPSAEGVVGILESLSSQYNADEKMLTFPSLSSPALNIDGSPASDFSEDKGYMAYYIKNPLQDRIPTENTLLSSFISLAPQQLGTTLRIFIPENPQPNDRYYLVIIAQDRAKTDGSQNPNPLSFTPNELGVKPQLLIIPPNTQ